MRKTVGGPATPVDIIKDSSGYLAQMVALLTGIAGSAPTALGVNHIPKFTGEIFFVDGTDGNDANDGLLPDSAVATITAGIALMEAGDALTVRAGTYDEAGLDLALDGMELWCEIGTIIQDTTPGIALVISGDYCLVRGAIIDNMGGIGYRVSGVGCRLESCLARQCTTAFDINGARTEIFWCRSLDHTTTGFDIATDRNDIHHCDAIVNNQAVRGFWLSADVADLNHLEECCANGNTVAGFELVAQTTLNVVHNCISGAGDGDVIDNGNNNFLDVQDEMASEHNEHIWPFSDGEGAAADPVTVNTDASDETHGAASAKDYWGEPSVVIPVGDMVSPYQWIGVTIFATSTGKTLRSKAYKIDALRLSGKGAGNAWDEGETDLTVLDGSVFQTNDLVWIYSTYKTNGEIVKVTGVAGNVVTIAREGSQFGAPNTGLRWNHTINAAATEVMYLIERATLIASLGFTFDFSASSARDHERETFHAPKALMGSDGILMRVHNSDDSVNNQSYDVSVIYHE